jgi:hypothetical protein
VWFGSAIPPGGSRGSREWHVSSFRSPGPDMRMPPQAVKRAAIDGGSGDTISQGSGERVPVTGQNMKTCFTGSVSAVRYFGVLVVFCAHIHMPILQAQERQSRRAVEIDPNNTLAL